MEKVAPDIAYRRLKNVSDWRLVEEDLRLLDGPFARAVEALRTATVPAAAEWCRTADPALGSTAACSTSRRAGAPATSWASRWQTV
ncbi:MAG: hypothetical protein OXB99_07185 [Acidimicrobiaceae bacterium]|nr:hypothetical protein [Acidimicrobiaceae bacterium]